MTPLLGRWHTRNRGGQRFGQQQWTPHVWFNLLLDDLVWYRGETYLLGYIYFMKLTISCWSKLRTNLFLTRQRSVFLLSLFGYYVYSLIIISDLFCFTHSFGASRTRSRRPRMRQAILLIFCTLSKRFGLWGEARQLRLHALHIIASITLGRS